MITRLGNIQVGEGQCFIQVSYIDFGSRESESAIDKSGSMRASQQERNVVGNTATRVFVCGSMEV